MKLLKTIKLLFVLILVKTNIYSQTKIYSGNNVICTGDSVVLYAPEHRGVIKWQQSTDGVNWTDIKNATTDSLGINPSVSTYFRTVICEGTCLPYNTDSVYVAIENAVSIAANSFIIDTEDWQKNLISISNDSTTYTFSSDVHGGNSFNAGDIFVSAEGDGFIRKTTEVITEDDNITVITTQANMEELFEKANIDFNIGLSAKSTNNKSATLINTEINNIATGVKESEDGFTFDFSNTPIYKDDFSTFSIKDGFVKFNPNYYFDIDFEDHTLTKLEFKTENASLNVDCNFLFNTTSKVDLVNKSKELVDYDKTYVYWVGLVPVVVVINTKLVAKLEINTTAGFSAETGFKNNYILSFGANYENSKWNGDYKLEPEFIAKPVDMGGTVNLNQKLIITPEVRVKFYGVAGPYCIPEMSEEFDATIASPSLNWDANLGVALNLKYGAKIEIFGKTLADYSKTYSVSETLWNAPDTVLIVSGNNQTGNQGYVLPEPTKVKVLDNLGNPLLNVPVYFEITAGGGSVNNNTIMTDNEGYAETSWTLGVAGEEQIMEVVIKKSNGEIISSQVFNSSSIPITYSIEIISGNNQIGEPGQTLPNPIVVLVKDQNDNPFEGAKVKFIVSEGSLTVGEATSAPDGTVSTEWTLGNSVGENTINIELYDSEETLLETIAGVATINSSDNLITNGGAENSLTGWNISSGNWTQRSTNPSPQSGNYYFFAGACSSGELYQTIDVSDNHLQIDNGNLTFTFSGYMRSWDQSPADDSKASIEYLNSQGSILESYNTGFQSTTSSWVYFEDSRIAPIGTRSIRINLTSIRNAGTNNDGYFDNLKLILSN